MNDCVSRVPTHNKHGPRGWQPPHERRGQRLAASPGGSWEKPLIHLGLGVPNGSPSHHQQTFPPTGSKGTFSLAFVAWWGWWVCCGRRREGLPCLLSEGGSGLSSSIIPPPVLKHAPLLLPTPPPHPPHTQRTSQHPATPSQQQPPRVWPATTRQGGDQVPWRSKASK